MCAGADGFGCYTIYTETGDMFEYELWGCTDYDIFTTELESPSGIALDGRGYVTPQTLDADPMWTRDRCDRSWRMSGLDGPCGP